MRRNFESGKSTRENFGTILMKKPKYDKKKIVKKLDTLWSIKIRERDKICQKCQKTKATQAAHIFSRRNLSTRWSLANGIGMCYFCHMFWAHREPVEFTLWITQKIGKSEFRSLNDANNSVFSASRLRDPKEVQKIIERLKTL